NRADAIALHLESCPECQRKMEDFRNTSARLTAWQVAPCMLHTPAFPEKPKRTSLFWRWRWVLATVAACPVVLAVYLIRPLPSLPRGFNAQMGYTVDQVKAKNPVVIDDSGGLANRFDLETDSRKIAREFRLTIRVKDVAQARSSLDEILQSR